MKKTINILTINIVLVELTLIAGSCFSMDNARERMGAPPLHDSQVAPDC